MPATHSASRTIPAMPFPRRVLELFHTGLRHRDIFATVSDRASSRAALDKPCSIIQLSS